VDWAVGFFASFEVQEGVGVRDVLVTGELELFEVLIGEVA
jgi:hypothetical protein